MIKFKLADGTFMDVSEENLSVFKERYPNAVEAGKGVDFSTGTQSTKSNNMALDLGDGSLVYEYRTEGGKNAWGKSTDGGQTFDIVEAGNIPEEWFEDPKFKEVYKKEK